MPAGLGQQSGGMSRSDTVGSFTRRKRNAIMVTGSLLIVSVLILTIGLAATTRTQNVTVGGYYPGVILGFGSFLGIIGVHLIENKRQMLVASIVFISFGVVAAFCCAIVDGVFAARHIVSMQSERIPCNTKQCCSVMGQHAGSSRNMRHVRCAALTCVKVQEQLVQKPMYVSRKNDNFKNYIHISHAAAPWTSENDRGHLHSLCYS
uniref:Transmembrane protein 255A-like n=1 Tax=Scleropages formosus TaxID=113540 RepID=A0A8C9T7D0_SCLFO